MKILIINVSLRPTSPTKMFPVGLGFVATAIKNAGLAFDVLDVDLYRYTDQYVEDYLRSKHYDVVCMGCIVTGYKIVKNYAAIIKKVNPDTKIIVGNSVATSIFHTLLTRTAVDFAVIGEGDVTVVELLQALSGSRTVENVPGVCFLKDGKVICTPPRAVTIDISTIPLLDFSLFDVEKYIECSKVYAPDPLPMPRDDFRALPVNTARGCVANCGFCYHVFRGQRYRYRSAASIVDEIKQLIRRYALNYVFFWDELTFFSKKNTHCCPVKLLHEC